MFAKYDLNKWPMVYITMVGNIKSYLEYNEFTTTWLNLYDKSEPFTMLFDATNFGEVSIFYAIKMAMFIKKIKRKSPQYLQKSIIMLQSNWLKHLINLMFFIESPVAPVYVYYKDEHGEKSLDELIDLVNKGEIDVFHKFQPKN